MKRYIEYGFILSITFAAVIACSKQDSIYKQYVKSGGYDYPAKAIGLSYQAGYKNVIIKWEKPMDPSVLTAKLYWDNYSKSCDVDYSEHPDGKVEIPVDNLEDRSYTFDIINFDNSGNKSLPAEITVSPYGDGWMVSRAERSVLSAVMNGNDATVILTKSTDEMVATKFRYLNRAGEWVEVKEHLLPGKDTIVFIDAMKGKRFEYSSSYCPKHGKDTVWRAWVKSFDGISYPLNGRRWSVSATAGQIFDENTPDKIFDGQNLSGFRYHSSKNEIAKKIFPKIISIDTHTAAGEEFAFTGFKFCESPESANLRYIKDFMIYIGNSPYNPDEKEYEVKFGIPFIIGLLSTSESEQTVRTTHGGVGRYLSIVFKDSWSPDGYIDLWELIPYGYVPSQAD